MVPMTRTELDWADAIFDTIYPRAPRGELPLGMADLDIAGFFDGIFMQAPPLSALGIRASMWLIALAPLFVVGRFTSIAGIDPDERERVLLALMSSRIYLVRSLVLALKGIAALLYCGDSRVRARILGPAPSRAVVPLSRLTSSSQHEPHAERAPHEHRTFA